MKPAGLYIDFPFCIARCAFCAFSVQGYRSRWADRYLAALHKEILWYGKSSEMADHRVTSIYLGGGTPTQYSTERLLEVITLCRACFNVSEDVEISLEAHPATVDFDTLSQLRKGGINRLSLGIQSFTDHHLKRLGRRHSAAEAVAAFYAARRAGFENIAMDLIYGLPEQTLEDWNQTLQKAISLAPQHLSIYGLSIEEGTLFHRQRSEGRLPLPSEEEEIVFYQTARKTLVQAGYPQYEISNFARPGNACRHNLLYWNRGESLAVGLAAHSFLNGTHRANTDSLAAYIEKLAADDLPVIASEKIEPERQTLDRVIFGLRKIEGIPLKLAVDDPVIYQKTQQLIQDGLLRINDENIALSEKGLLIADEVAVALL